MGLDPWEQAVLRKWKRMRNLYNFLEREVHHINQQCFNGQLSVPQLVINRTKYSQNWRGDFLGARYHPPRKDQDARISLYPFFLLEKKDIQATLAHELIHHWEYLNGNSGRIRAYPKRVDDLIHDRFPNNSSRSYWLSKHSKRFLDKSWEVTRKLKIPIEGFLFR